MQALYEAYKDKVAFLFVYVREAHPVKQGKEGGAEARSPKDIAQTQSLAERAMAATDCLKALKVTIPVLIDTMDGKTEKGYGGHPAGTAVIDRDGRIGFTSRGPNGIKPKDAEKVLKELLANKGKLGADVPRPKETSRAAADRPTKP